MEGESIPLCLAWSDWRAVGCKRTASMFTPNYPCLHPTDAMALVGRAPLMPLRHLYQKRLYIFSNISVPYCNKYSFYKTELHYGGLYSPSWPYYMNLWEKFDFTSFWDCPSRGLLSLWTIWRTVGSSYFQARGCLYGCPYPLVSFHHKPSRLIRRTSFWVQAFRWAFIQSVVDILPIFCIGLHFWCHENVFYVSGLESGLITRSVSLPVDLTFIIIYYI